MDAYLANKENLVEKWAPVLEGVDNDYTRKVTAQLLENQAKAVIADRMDEALGDTATTTGKIGTFQKFAFPLVRRVYPELLANKIVGVQPMQGPVSQVFYLGASRSRWGGGAGNEQTVYSKWNMTYRGLVASSIGSISKRAADLSTETGTFGGKTGQGLTGDEAATGFDVSNVLHSKTTGYEESENTGGPSATMGGQIASWPNPSSILGFSPSAGERLDGTGIPEMNFHIQQQAVASRTRKMRALWTLEASQDLKAYHNLDLEQELTTLLGKELQLEIDRELIEDLRMIAYGKTTGTLFHGWDYDELDRPNSNNMTGGPGNTDGLTPPRGGDSFIPANFNYDFASDLTSEATRSNYSQGSNVFVVDFSASALSFSPRHIGDVYANIMAVLNIASQDIYRTTFRGPGNWILTSPLVASFLESSSQLQGGTKDGVIPGNMGKTSVVHKGKLAGKYDVYVDPLFPTDEIIMGYKGDSSMDAGLIYAPYIPLQ